MIRPFRPLALALIAMFALPGAATFCDEYYSDWGFSIDLPEGFTPAGGDGKSRYSFGSPDGAVVVDIVVYPRDRFISAKAGADDTARKLAARSSFTSFQYEGRDAAAGELSFSTGSSALQGIGFFVNDAESPAGAGTTPEASKAYDLVVLAYTQAAAFEDYRDFIESSIDGFSMQYSRRTIPGPLGAKHRATLGPVKQSDASIQFGEATIKAGWNPREAAISQVLVEREYRVLSAYADEPEQIEAAIRRFYRMIFRDATPALDRLALEMSKAWETGAWSGKVPGPSLPAAPDAKPKEAAPRTQADANPGSPRFGATADPRAYAAALLRWVQGFKYERDPKGSDVVNPISSAFEGRGDCDSRALVMSILLRRENIDSILMISLVHEHALSAVAAPGPGARFPYLGTSWLVAETTAKVDIGRIDATQADPKAWIGVPFPR